MIGQWNKEDYYTAVVVIGYPHTRHKANKIIVRAQKDLLNERVRQNNFTINVLRKEINSISEDLRAKLPAVVYDEVSQFTAQAQLTQHRKSKSRQQEKFARLQNSARASRSDTDRNWRKSEGFELDSELKDKWVKNLSSRPLTETERDVLARGLNFSVAPNRIPHVDLITATESAIKHNNLCTSDAEDLRSKVSSCLVNAKTPNSNLNKQQREAIKTLGGDNDITILPADKGRCTVVLDKTEYHSKVCALLNDTKTYEPLKRDPTSGYRKKVIDCLQNLEKSEVIDRNLYHKLYPGESIPKFYGLPKIHKPHAPLRPIVSCVDSVTYNVAKHIAYIIGPLVGKSKHHIVNSQDFVNKVSDIHLEDNETITSYDVSALFTCVPPKEAVNCVRDFLRKDNTLKERTDLSPDQVCEVLELCLNTTYFVYDGKFYRQRHGCAMGSPVSPIVVNLFMEQFEQLALTSYAENKGIDKDVDKGDDEEDDKDEDEDEDEDDKDDYKNKDTIANEDEGENKDENED
ncbi:uncharacterized protein [Amphiura filiformis]|uniref:uncharacterized protein n=1 Tax=Amphiura filiformis TaxID=82378 RepID=UPI003B220893